MDRIQPEIVDPSPVKSLKTLSVTGEDGREHTVITDAMDVLHMIE
jgi:hypothetical protein